MVAVLDLKAFKALIAPLGAQGLSQNAIARSLGIESSAMSRWLSGGNASYPQVAAVAERLGTPVTQLWRGPVPRKYAAAGVPHGTPGASPVTAAIESAFARGYAAAEFTAIAEAAADIARRARIAAQRMGTTPPDGGKVLGEAAESLELSREAPGAPRKSRAGTR